MCGGFDSGLRGPGVAELLFLVGVFDGDVGDFLALGDVGVGMRAPGRYIGRILVVLFCFGKCSVDLGHKRALAVAHWANDGTRALGGGG